MECGEANPSDREIFECGGRNFVFGNQFSFEDKKVVCECGSDKFSLMLRINRSPIHDKTYKCSECSNIIRVQVYVENNYI